MKIHYLLILISFQIFSQNSTKQKVSENEKKIYGNVKAIYEESYSAIFDSINKSYVFDTTCFKSQISRKFDSISKKYKSDTLFLPCDKHVSLTKYDTLKNEYQIINYYTSDTIITYIENSYDSEGRLVRKISRDKYFNENIYFKYDNKGNLIKIFYADAINSKEGRVHEFIYNRKNQLVEESNYQTSNSIQTSLYVVPPSKNDEKVIDKRKIKFFWKYKYYYNSSGQLIKQLDYDIYGNVQSVHEYNYLETSKSVDEVIYYEGKICTHIVSYFDEKNRLIEVIRDELNYSERFQGVFLYDDHGNLIKNIRNSSYQPKEEWLNEYIYDENGNWVSMITKGPSQYLYLTKRKIEYY